MEHGYRDLTLRSSLCDDPEAAQSKVRGGRGSALPMAGSGLASSPARLTQSGGCATSRPRWTGGHGLTHGGDAFGSAIGLIRGEHGDLARHVGLDLREDGWGTNIVFTETPTCRGWHVPAQEPRWRLAHRKV